MNAEQWFFAQSQRQASSPRHWASGLDTTRNSFALETAQKRLNARDVNYTEEKNSYVTRNIHVSGV
jgi:hypothetical protein